MKRVIQKIRHPFGGSDIAGTLLQDGDRLLQTDVYAATTREWLQNPVGEGTVLRGTNTTWVRPEPWTTPEKPEYRVIDVLQRNPENIQEILNQLHQEGYDYLDVIGPYLFFRKQEMGLYRESDRCGECDDCLVAAEYLKTTVPNYLKERACQRPKTIRPTRQRSVKPEGT